MESIIARALEYTLKYWLKSFSRDQFKLQGHTAQLSNLDINGDALHASTGLPSALNVTTAKIGKLEITLPSVSNVRTQAILLQIDRLDLVLKENVNADSDEPKSHSSPGSAQSTPTSGKGTSGKGGGYRYADKIADGMTLQVGTVNLLIETNGGAHQQGGATWASPLASITIRDLLLYTTNENWQVVNLKEARDFSNGKKCIYVFKKLEWRSLSIDLLPHPDMFSDAINANSDNNENDRDDDGAKRLFFGGERFLEGISGEAYITVQRTEQNNPLGLEVQLHITEAVCPSLSEPGLRALLRFMTGFYVCLNRDVDPMGRQRSTEAAGRSIVSIVVDHIFLCIKDAEFQLDLLMQSLFFSRASISDGTNTKYLSRVTVGGLFLRDTFSHPPYTLILPSMHHCKDDSLQVPVCGDNFCPAIYPLGDQLWHVDVENPLIQLHSLQTAPSPAPPSLASQTVIECRPLLINLHEESFLRISSFLADGIVVSPAEVLQDFSVHSFVLALKGFDLCLPLNSGTTSDLNGIQLKNTFFSGPRLQLKNMILSQSPHLKCNILNLDKDPVCFSMWTDQAIDASQKKWTVQISHITLSLEIADDLAEHKKHPDSVGLWTCVQLQEMCLEAAMVTTDGTPLITLPPPEGIVRIGVSIKQCQSNTSAQLEELFFVFNIYTFFLGLSEKITKIGNTHTQTRIAKAPPTPSDTALSLAIHELQLKFPVHCCILQGMPLMQFDGKDVFLKFTHQILGGAFAISANLTWGSLQVDCCVQDAIIGTQANNQLLEIGKGHPQMTTVFWIDDALTKNLVNTLPFLEINMTYVTPYDVKLDTECRSLNVSTKISGVRIGGGMNYTQSLLHRLGVLDPDGQPGQGLMKGIKYFSSGTLENLFRSLISPPPTSTALNIQETKFPMLLLQLGLGRHDDIDVCIELKDWLFALEGVRDAGEKLWHYDGSGITREESCWHARFKNMQLKLKSCPQKLKRACRIHNYPVGSVNVSVEGLRAQKPRPRNGILRADVITLRENNLTNGNMQNLGETSGGGVDFEVSMAITRKEDDVDISNWEVDSIKFSVKEPFGGVATKEELEEAVHFCRSEADSVGKISAGIMRILKLEETMGKGSIDQCSNLGSQSSAKIIKTQSNLIIENPNQDLELTVASLESVLSDSQAKCSALVMELSSPEMSVQHLENIKHLNQKLEDLRILLVRLRTQV